MAYISQSTVLEGRFNGPRDAGREGGHRGRTWTSDILKRPPPIPESWVMSSISAWNSNDSERHDLECRESPPIPKSLVRIEDEGKKIRLRCGGAASAATTSELEYEVTQQLTANRGEHLASAPIRTMTGNGRILRW